MKTSESKQLNDLKWTLGFIQDELMHTRILLDEMKKEEEAFPDIVKNLRLEIELLEQGVDEYQTLIAKLKSHEDQTAEA